jgi:SOS-response transcriptional repressor LexA
MSACAGSEPFALRVLGDSMAPEFKHGAVIIVEPAGLLESGCYVVAEHNSEYIFRQLIIDGQRWLLKPVNDQYPTIEIAGLQEIKGRVVQKAGRNKKDRRHFL